MKEKYNIQQEEIQNIILYIQMLIKNFNSNVLQNNINEQEVIHNNININNIKEEQIIPNNIKNIHNNDNINHCDDNKINNPDNHLLNTDTYILHNNNLACNDYNLNNLSFNINKYINEEKGKNKKTNQHISEQFLFPTHLVIMCAAASDFYIPYDEMHENKIDSNYSPLSIQLCLTPKFYKIINSHFPLLKYCIFKLEDEEKILIDKSNERIKYTDLLIANLLTQRYDYVYIFKKQFEYVLLKKSNSEQIENDICYEICKHFSIL